MSDITERLAALDSCVVSDALDALGIAGVATGLSRLATDTKVVGRVHTVKLEDAKGRKAERHLCTGAVGAAAPGEVIVVEHHDRSDCAGWGGLLSRAASVKGIAGTIIERRDQVLITFLLLASFCAWTLRNRCSSTNGPFLRLRGILCS